MKVYVHIGPHKTGTTAFQSFLSEHADEIRGYYPDSGTGENHHGLAWAFVRDGWERAEMSRTPIVDEPVAFLAHALDQAASRRGPLILSSEEFSRLDSDAVADFVGILSGHEVRVVAVHRDFRDLALSNLVERAKDGALRSVSSELGSLLDEPSMRLSQVLGAWSTHADVSLLPFRAGRPLLGRLALAIGQTHLEDRASRWRRENERWPAEQMAVVQKFYEQMKREPEQVFREHELSAIVRHALRPMLVWGVEAGLLMLADAEELEIPPEWQDVVSEHQADEAARLEAILNDAVRITLED